MGLIRLILRTLSVLMAVLAGNLVGDRLRADWSGEPSRSYKFIHKTAEGDTVLAINLVLTNFIPGLLLALSAKPRWLWGFLGGALASGLLSDDYEGIFLDWIRSMDGSNQPG